MRYLDATRLQSCASLTRFVRHDDSELARVVRDALAERRVDAGTSAVADFCPESASLDDGAPAERHHLVIVTVERQAFVGLLERSRTSAEFIAWRNVPSASIPNRDDIIRRINTNRRGQSAWNTGIDPWIRDPKDVIYNELIEAARTLLDGGSSPPAAHE